MKRVLRALGAVMVLIAAAVLLGTIVPRPLLRTESDGAPKLRRILVLSNPIHTDIAVPVDEEVAARFGFLRQDGMPMDAAGVRYLIFGRGGREFYIATPTWDRLKPMPLVKGLTLDRAVMHVEVAGNIPEPRPGVRGFDLDARQFDTMLSHIRDSFLDAAGTPVLIPGAGYGDYDRFYEADGYFTALLGCNTWTATALREAGVRTGWWNPLPVTLQWSLDLYN